MTDGLMDDPNKEAVGLEPSWAGAPGSEPEPEPKGKKGKAADKDEDPEPELEADDEK